MKEDGGCLLGWLRVAEGVHGGGNTEGLGWGLEVSRNQECRYMERQLGLGLSDVFQGPGDTGQSPVADLCVPHSLPPSTRASLSPMRPQAQHH